MGFKLLPSHSCIRKQIKKLSKKFVKLENDLSEVFDSLEQNPMQGDRFPGFGDIHVRKLRIALKAQNIGKSGGPRLIFMVLEDKEKIIRIALYLESPYIWKGIGAMETPFGE